MKSTIMRRYIRPIILQLVLTTVASAQDSSLDLLRDQFHTRIHDIVHRAEAAIGLAIVDIESGEMFSINGDLSFPTASAIKIPVLIEMLNQENRGDLSLTERIQVAKDAIVGGAGVLQHFRDGSSELSLGDLAVLMIVLSDNTAANLLIDRVGMAHVNRMLDENGFAEIRLQRRMMDGAASARNEENLATPEAAARLMVSLYDRTLTDPDVAERALEILAMPAPTLLDVPSGVSILNKTGTLESVAVDWALVDLPHRPYAFVFMSVFSAGNAAREAAAEISRLAYRYFSTLSRASEHGVLVDPALRHE